MNLLPGYYATVTGIMRDVGFTERSSETGISAQLLQAKDDRDDLLICRVEIWTFPEIPRHHVVFQCYDAETHEKVGDAERTICLTYDEAWWYYEHKYVL